MIGEGLRLGDAVARSVVARPAGVQHDRRLVGDGDGLVFQEVDAGRPALQRTRRDRDLPARADRALAGRGSVGEGDLGDQAVAQSDERVAALEDPGVHDVAHRLAGDLFDGVPQVGRDRVGVAVLAQVVADAVAVGLGTRGTARACAESPRPFRR